VIGGSGLSGVVIAIALGLIIMNYYLRTMTRTIKQKELWSMISQQEKLEKRIIELTESGKYGTNKDEIEYSMRLIEHLERKISKLSKLDAMVKNVLTIGEILTGFLPLGTVLYSAVSKYL
jgi:hypothetical protein